jgi:molecular chaperone GrpE
MVFGGNMHDPETADPAKTGAAGAGDATEHQSPSGATDATASTAAAANEPTAEALGVSSDSTLEQDLQAALAKANENYELYLRARADSENIRRRAQDELAKAHKFAIESFAESLVPVMDSLEKALETQNATAESLREGASLTLKQLQSAFEKSRLTAIDPKGEKFDPHKHQAISSVAAEGVAPNHVVTVLQKGWMIADRVLRPALVTVAAAK